MGNIERFYPNLKPLLETKGGSVQEQDRYAIRSSIDQRGEQTINRNAKTSGGIKSFVSNEKSVLKWCLNRSEQARNSRALLELCGAVVVNDWRKPCRPSKSSLVTCCRSGSLQKFTRCLLQNSIVTYCIKSLRRVS